MAMNHTHRNIVSHDDLVRIDDAAIGIIADNGVKIDDRQLRQLALEAGAKPSASDNGRICLPAKMTRELLARAPKSATIADRRGRRYRLAPDGECTFWTGAALNYWRDGRISPIAETDLRDFARIADQMDSLTALVGTSVDEAPPAARDVVGLRIMAENTTLHLRPLLFTGEHTEYLLEMAQIISGDKPLAENPIMSLGYSCLPPLHWAAIPTTMWRLSKGSGLPVMLNGEPTAGLTGPVTLAGSLVLGHAEILSGIALLQLLDPGRPVIHNLGFAHSADMRTATVLAGTPECALLASAGAQLARLHNLPCASWMGTDSMCDDHQATLEKTMTASAHVQSGVNVIWGFGQLESEKTLSPVQLLLDNEISRSLLRINSSIEVNDRTMAAGAISDVIEGGDEFLMHEHTLDNFRDAFVEAPLLHRSNRSAWSQDSSPTLAGRVNTEIDRILSQETKPKLSDDQLKQIRKIESSVLSKY